jgi:hypothetical protein
LPWLYSPFLADWFANFALLLKSDVPAISLDDRDIFMFQLIRLVATQKGHRQIVSGLVDSQIVFKLNILLEYRL